MRRHVRVFESRKPVGGAQPNAVNNYGYVSMTSTVSVVYLAGDVLTVSTNGLGKIAPVLGGQLLPLGSNYVLTATPASGFVFTNWTGSLIATNPVLKFAMATNLSLTANFVDKTKPTIAVANLKAGQWISNAVFTVNGTASDNWQVTNVWLSFNGGVWTNAVLASNGTNWSASLNLVEGTNRLSVYAVDKAGNLSATNSVAFRYVVSGVLRVQITGLGTLSPNYSNALLAINQVYSMTATPRTGFIFTNWMGGTTLPLAVLTNATTVRFSMTSNLTLQANLLDVGKPTCAITSPTANQRWSNAVFTVRGTAKDNLQVSNVWCLTNGVWGRATITSSRTNWSLDVALAPGTNVVKAAVVDGAGNWSPTQSVSFVRVVSDRLAVQATGPCTMSPNYSNAVLEINKSYTTTVTPGKGFVLSNWVGTVSNNLVLVANTNKVTFTMRSNLVLQANIIPNPFILVKGTYNGLFTHGVRAQESSGFFTLTLTTNGSYSGSLKCGADTYPFTGQFDVGGVARQVVSRPKTNAWVVGISLNFAAQQLSGWVSNGVSGGWVAELGADRAVFNAQTNPATQYAGKYTLSIPGATNWDGTVWLGDGYLTLSVDTGGNVTYSGSLADGTSVGPASASLSRYGYFPLYVPLYSGKGSVFSSLGFDQNQPATGLEGWLSWIKLPQGGAYYPAGLTNEVTAEGARYTPPTNTTSRVIQMTNGVVMFEGGNLNLSLTNKLSLSLTVSNGVFTGGLTEPGLTRSNLFRGVLLQDESSGYGYFLETNRSGRVLFWPVP